MGQTFASQASTTPFARWMSRLAVGKSPHSPSLSFAERHSYSLQMHFCASTQNSNIRLKRLYLSFLPGRQCIWSEPFDSSKRHTRSVKSPAFFNERLSLAGPRLALFTRRRAYRGQNSSLLQLGKHCTLPSPSCHR